MTKKEKAIIKRLKDTFSEDVQAITFYKGGIIEIRKILNLIEKLQKEIEDWKDVCHSLTDEEELENKIRLFKPSIKVLNQEGATKEKQFLSKLTKYYKTLLKEKKQIFKEMKRRNEKCD